MAFSPHWCHALDAHSIRLARQMNTEIVAYWSQRDVTSPFFHLPLRLGGMAWDNDTQQPLNRTLMEITDSLDTDTLFAATPALRNQ